MKKYNMDGVTVTVGTDYLAFQPDSKDCTYVIGKDAVEYVLPHIEKHGTLIKEPKDATG